MKRFLAILVMVLVMVLTGCTLRISGKEIFTRNWSYGGELFTKTEVLEEIVDAQNKLSVSNTSGKIDMVPWDGDTLKITAVKKIMTSESSEKAYAQLDRITADIDKSAESIGVDIHINNDMPGFHSPSVDIEVMVPKQFVDFEVEVTSGSIVFSGFECIEKFGLAASSGTITAEDCSASEYRIGITSGTVNAQNIKGDGNLSMSSGRMNMSLLTGSITHEATSGSTTITGFEGKIDSRISSGRIRVEDAYLKESSSFLATSGKIAVDVFKLDNSGLYRFEASSGDISLYMPQEAGFDLDASATSGNIRCSFDIYGKEDDAAGRRRELKGTAGSGGPDISISITSGYVSIEKR